MSRRAPRATKAELRASASSSLSDTAVVAELRAIERAFAPPDGATLDAYRAQLREWREREPDAHLEYQIPESFARVLFVRLCERYGVQARGIPDDALMLRVHAPPGFAAEILWPQYSQMGAVLARFLHAHAGAVMTAWLAAAPTR